MKSLPVLPLIALGYLVVVVLKMVNVISWPWLYMLYGLIAGLIVITGIIAVHLSLVYYRILNEEESNQER